MLRCSSRFLFIVTALMPLLTVACGSSTPSSPTGPSSPSTSTGSTGSPSASSSCRLVATVATFAHSGPGFSGTTNQTCTVSGATVNCTARYSDSTGQSSTITGTATYASVGDIVDEIRVNPPLMLVQATASTTAGTAGTFTSSTTHTYDGQRRLTRITGVSAAGTSTSTYTAWDASGRPTAGTDVGPGFNNAITISYNDAQRTKTTTVNSGLVTTVETYDANGNLIRQASTGGGVTSTTDITIASTQQVCR